MKFPESAKAHQWLDGLGGIEIGGAAHNPFNIPGCRNVDYTDAADTVFKLAEIGHCGESMPVDVVDEGDKLATFANNSLDYVLSSHVFEHFPDPLGALMRWSQVVRPGGIIFMIVPHRDALESDVGRPLSAYHDVHEAWVRRHGLYTYPGMPARWHYHVYSLESLTAIVERFNAALSWTHPGLSFEVVDSAELDDKVGNGFTLVLRVHKP